MIAVSNHRYENGAKSLENDQKAGSAVTLFSSGRSRCFESASPATSGDLRAYYNWVVFEAGGCRAI